MEKNHSILFQKWIKGNRKKPLSYNLSPEQNVGFMSYELKIKGTTQLACTSSAQVKAKSADFIKKLPPETFKQYRKTPGSGGRLSEIIKAWATKQDKLSKKGNEMQGSRKYFSEETA